MNETQNDGNKGKKAKERERENVCMCVRKGERDDENRQEMGKERRRKSIEAHSSKRSEQVFKPKA